MSTKVFLYISGLFALTVLGRPAWSEECPPALSINDCVNFHQGRALSDIEKANAARVEAEARTRERLNKFVTGLGIENSTARSAVTDFLARIAAAVESGNIGD